MKIQEREYVAQGLGGGHYRTRVRVLAEGEEKPVGAVEVGDETEVSEWHYDSNQEQEV